MFTDKSIKGLKPKESAYRLYEKGVDKGFGVKVTPAGSMSFFIQYAGVMGNKSFTTWAAIHPFLYQMLELNVEK